MEQKDGLYSRESNNGVHSFNESGIKSQVDSSLSNTENKISDGNNTVVHSNQTLSDKINKTVSDDKDFIKDKRSWKWK